MEGRCRRDGVGRLDEGEHAGAELSDENIMAQAANLRNFRVGLLLPESRINASPNDYKVITYMKLQRFNGVTWDCVD